jgi:hypothetical protein
LGRKIPTQQVLIETLRKIRPSNDLVLNAISLNIYSKLGGTAWTIEKDEKDSVLPPMELDFWVCDLEITQNKERDFHDKQKTRIYSRTKSKNSTGIFRQSGICIRIV